MMIKRTLREIMMERWTKTVVRERNNGGSELEMREERVEVLRREKAIKILTLDHAFASI